MSDGPPAGRRRARPDNKSLPKTKGVLRRRRRELDAQVREGAAAAGRPPDEPELDVELEVGLDVLVVLPYVVLQLAPGAAPECSVCQDVHSGLAADPCVMLACGHVLGRACVDRWLAHRRLCPMCRHPVTFG